MTKENMNNENMLNVKTTSPLQSEDNVEQPIVYILDANILLHEPFAFLSFKEHDVVVPMTVLEELDSINDRRKDVSRDVRVAIRALEDILRDASPEQVIAGVKLPQNDDQHPSGSFAIINDYALEKTAHTLSFNENDNRIINAALYIQKKTPHKKIVLVTKDINMRLKAKGAGLAHVEDYRTDQLIDDIQFLTKGYHQFEGDFWQHIQSVDSETEGRNTTHYVARNAVPLTYINECLLDEGDTFAGKITGWDDDKISILDPTIDWVILTGPAESGKAGITSTIISIFVNTSVKIKSLAKFLQKKAIINFSFTNQIKTLSKLSLGAFYV